MVLALLISNPAIVVVEAAAVVEAWAVASVVDTTSKITTIEVDMTGRWAEATVVDMTTKAGTRSSKDPLPTPVVTLVAATKLPLLDTLVRMMASSSVCPVEATFVSPTSSRMTTDSLA